MYDNFSFDLNIKYLILFTKFYFLVKLFAATQFTKSDGYLILKTNNL